MEEKKKRGRPRTRPIKVPKLPEEKYGPRPWQWITGPDEYKHSMYTPWQRMKAQANFRGEEFTLKFEDFYNLWKDHWPQRGRGIDDLCMSRNDHSGPWSKKNTIIITRKEHYKNQVNYRASTNLGKTYKPRKAKK